MHTLILGKLTSRLAVWMINNKTDQRGNDTMKSAHKQY